MTTRLAFDKPVVVCCPSSTHCPCPARERYFDWLLRLLEGNIQLGVEEEKKEALAMFPAELNMFVDNDEQFKPSVRAAGQSSDERLKAAAGNGGFRETWPEDPSELPGRKVSDNGQRVWKKKNNNIDRQAEETPRFSCTTSVLLLLLIYCCLSRPSSSSCNRQTPVFIVAFSLSLSLCGYRGLPRERKTPLRLSFPLRGDVKPSAEEKKSGQSSITSEGCAPLAKKSEVHLVAVVKSREEGAVIETFLFPLLPAPSFSLTLALYSRRSANCARSSPFSPSTRISFSVRETCPS